jgi:transcriptional regulator with XRE-family HTH domain
VAEQRPRDIGSRLKDARESRGRSHRQIADATKLSVRVVEAIERGRRDQMPSGIYRRAAVRAVAAEVGLDPESTLRAFLAEHPDDLPMPGATRVVEPPTPAPSRWLQHAMTLVGALVPLAAGIVYFTMSSPARSAPTPVPAVADRAGDPWRPEIVPAGGFVETPAPGSRAVVMLITLSSRCELRIVADGREVIGRVVEAGEQFQVSLNHEVELSGDNAGAVQFSINGRAGRMLGAAGEPLSVRLDRDDYDAYLVRP